MGWFVGRKARNVELYSNNVPIRPQREINSIYVRSAQNNFLNKVPGAREVITPIFSSGKLVGHGNGKGDVPVAAFRQVGNKKAWIHAATQWETTRTRESNGEKPRAEFRMLRVGRLGIWERREGEQRIAGGMFLGRDPDAKDPEVVSLGKRVSDAERRVEPHERDTANLVRVHEGAKERRATAAWVLKLNKRDLRNEKMVIGRREAAVAELRKSVEAAETALRFHEREVRESRRDYEASKRRGKAARRAVLRARRARDQARRERLVGGPLQDPILGTLLTEFGDPFTKGG